jgi:hypothetical protein
MVLEKRLFVLCIVKLENSLSFFLDDVLVLGQSFEQHIQNLTEVFQRFREYGIKLKAKKCDFLRRK